MKTTLYPLLGSSLVLLTSCALPVDTPVISPTVTATPTIDISAASPATPSFMPFYLEPYYAIPHFSELAFADAQFSLTIEEISHRCHPLDEPLVLRLVFRNHSNSTLVFPEPFRVSINHYVQNNVIVMFWPADQNVYPVPSSDHYGTPPKSTGYHKVAPAGGVLKKIIEFSLPKEIFVRQTDGEERPYVWSVGPGWYYLKVEYWLMQYDEWGRFEDIVGKAFSNRLEICVE